jgi:hypothetical protein
MTKQEDCGGKIETAETRNSSMHNAPAPEPLNPLIRQQPQAIGDKIFPAVRD